eukprot:m.304211 g.304211  ORF g.304211 m.304211 type:complete len:66 (-) comp15896_c0_seq2:5623-5820(-)
MVQLLVTYTLRLQRAWYSVGSPTIPPFPNHLTTSPSKHFKSKRALAHHPTHSVSPQSTSDWQVMT